MDMGSETSLKTYQRGGLQPPQPSSLIRLLICNKEDWKQCDFASASEMLKEAHHFLSEQ